MEQNTEGVILSIAIVNWNTARMTKECIQSIIDNTRRINYELIVVDNASTDDSVKIITENFPQVTLIKNIQNLIFAEPNNQALEISRGKYFLLLNSDTIVHGDALGQMVDFLDTHEEAGGVTCTLLNSDGSIQYNMHRRFPSFLGLSFGYLYKRYPRLKTKWAKEYLMLDNKFEKIQKIDQAAGTCIMIRKDIINQVGGLFDAERFPLLYNDVDLCYRLYKKGFGIYLIPDAFITHLKGQSIKKLGFSPHMKEVVFSSLSFFKKHKKYVDYILLKLEYLIVFSAVALCSLVLFMVKKNRYTDFKDSLSILLSAVMENRN
ncbi:MAG: glycosyltransferase family 2 protein [Dehalococcoidia bacterium]